MLNLNSVPLTSSIGGGAGTTRHRMEPKTFWSNNEV